MKYEDIPEYQAEIAAQYKTRNLQVEPTRVRDVLSALGLDVKLSDIIAAEGGNMNATFLAGEYVVKLNQNPRETKFAANTIVSDALPKSKVVQTVLHDHYKISEYEVLVMKRAPGEMWLKKMCVMTEGQNKTLFASVLDVVNECRTIQYTDKFGYVTDIAQDPGKNGFDTFAKQLAKRLDSYVRKLQQLSYVDQEQVGKIDNYIRANLHLFENDVPSFVHTDLHMGNIMHEDGELTAVIDFDSSQFAPAYRVLMSLIGTVDNPAQYVEGTSLYENYKGRKFEYFYSVIKEKLPDLLEEENLGLKLNILGIIEGLMWASEEWSKQWTKETVKKLVDKEVVESNDYSSTYYFPIIEKIKAS